MKKQIIAVSIVIGSGISLVGICLASLTRKPQLYQQNSIPEAPQPAVCSTNKSSSLQDSEKQNNPTVNNKIKNTHIIELTDKFYVAYINDIFMNQDDYIGKTLRLQGAYSHYTYDFGAGKHSVDYVYRNGPGCCGNDGSMAGFEFVCKDPLPPLKNDDWIEVTGILSTYEDCGISFMQLKDAVVTIPSVRGNINVYN